MITAIITSDSPRARRGFSLAELIVVLAILAVAAAIAVPRFASAGSAYRARGAAERLADSIRDAASTARAKGTTVRVRVNVGTDNYNAAILSPLAYIEISSFTASPFEADLTRVDYGNNGSSVDISGHGTFSTAVIYALKAGNQRRAVWIDAESGTVNTGTIQEAAAFKSSARYK